MSARMRTKPKHDEPILETVHVEGITYQRKLINCGKERCRKGCAAGRPSHGPYWYAISWNDKLSKTVAHYVGKELPRVDEFLDRPEMNK